MHTLVYYGRDQIAGWMREASAPADDQQAQAVLLGPAEEAAGAVEVIPSWVTEPPPGSWIEVQLRVRTAEGWSKYYRIASWDTARSTSRRTSFSRQQDTVARVATDTLLLAAPAEAIQLRLLLCAAPGAQLPKVEGLTLCLTRALDVGSQTPHLAPCTPSLELPLLLSQFLSFPGGEGWCSPTSLAMCLAYWRMHGAPRLTAFTSPACVPDLTVPMVYDPAWEGTGNWAFNTAYAASLGLTSYVTRMHSLAQVARWVAAGVPVICSLAWDEGELEGAPGATAGHLNVIVGFEEGYVVVAEPASRDLNQIVRRYPARQLYACWQANSNGTVYLLYPPGHPRPTPEPGDAWV